MTGLVLADAGIILAGGAQQIAAAALTVLADIAMGIGAWVMLCAFLYLLALAVWRARRPRGRDTRPVLAVLPPLPASATEPCPWCDDPQEIDSSLCDCAAACGRRYCKGVRGA